MEFDGSVTIEHGQFGMEPESIAGVVRVGEKIDIGLHLVGELLSEPCGAPGEASQE